MRSVTHREMRNNSGEILRAVADGESVLVTNGGRPAAVISPPVPTTVAALVELGQARPPRRPLADLELIQRSSATTSSAEVIADARGRW